MITAVTYVNWMYRGTYFTLVVDVKEDRNPYPIPGESVGKLRIAHSWTDPEPLVEVEASDYERANGRLYFDFTAEVTASLLSKGYDLSVVLVSPTGSETPVFHGRFGLLPYNPGVTG